MLTNVQLEASVEDANGDKIGSVKFLIADPYTNELTHIVIDRDGLSDMRQQVVEAGQVSTVSDDGRVVQLNLGGNDVSGLPDFSEREYTNLGITDNGSGQTTGGYNGTGDTSAMGEVNNLTNPAVAGNSVPGYLYPSGGVLGVGPAQMGGGGGMTTPILPLSPNLDGPVGMPYNEKLNVPENSLIIRKGANVEALDGSLGRIKEVNFEQQSGKIQSFIIEKGLFFTHEYTVPIEMVESATEETVRLRANKADLENASASQN